MTGVYQMQIGNPGMLSDGDQAMVDCLHKAGIVPKNYDKEAYKKFGRARQKPAHHSGFLKRGNAKLLGGERRVVRGRQ